jgi:ribonuclease E
MSEAGAKRRYWRRPRRKKAASETGGAGDAASTPGMPDLSETGEPDETPAVVEIAGEPDEVPEAEGGVADESAAGAAADGTVAAEGSAPPKKRRRSRRRPKKTPEGVSEEAVPQAGEPGGSPEEAEVAEAADGSDAAPEAREDEMGPSGSAGDALAPESSEAEDAVAQAAPEAAQTAGEGEAGAGPAAPTGEQPRKRRRRRRRRKSKGQPAGEPAGAQGAESAVAHDDATDSALAVGLTEAEEPEPISPEEDGAGDVGDEEFEAEEEAGTGTRKVMLIDGLHAEEHRVAIVADGALDYYEVENQRKKAFKGNIYKGRVVNIAPAIEAAFVEFGGGRHGFLPLNEYCAGALMDHLGTWNEGDKRPSLRSGMEILVQVTKEESSIKGAALTSYISIAGRYMVMMLGMKRYGISKKITGEKERERIRKQMEKLEYPEHLGFIVRTVGVARPLKDLKADLQNLLKLWDRVVEGARANRAPALLYEEQDIVIRTLRDNYSADVTEVMMNSDAAHRKAAAFFDVYYPKQKGKLKLYRQRRPLFARFNLEEQVERVTARKVPLTSGGHIVIDRTEAIWTIDVNSGRSSKDRDIEDTAYRTNKEAAAEVTRQMRLRDIGGLIVIDFIDMESKAHNKEVERILKEGLKRDKAKSDVTSLGKFGLVAISRQRMGTSFYDILLKGCDACGGLGVVPTADAAVVRLFRRLHDELSRESKDGTRDVTVRVAPGLLETLLNGKRDDISRIERLCGGKVFFHADPTLPATAFAFGNGGGR